MKPGADKGAGSESCPVFLFALLHFTPPKNSISGGYFCIQREEVKPGMGRKKSNARIQPHGKRIHVNKYINKRGRRGLCSALPELRPCMRGRYSMSRLIRTGLAFQQKNTVRLRKV